MSMDVHERVAATRRRLVNRTAAALAVVLVLLLGTGLMMRALGGDDPDPTGAPAGDTPVSSTPSGGAAAETGDGEATRAGNQGEFVAPERRVVLPTGAEQINEYPVRFPHTPEGAAALVVNTNRYSATLDYATADEVARLYLDPSQPKIASESAAHIVQLAREELGIPKSGAVPVDYATITRPIGVQWKQVSKDVYDIAILANLEYRTGADTVRKLVAATSRVKWFPDGGTNGGDWKIVLGESYEAPAGGQLGTRAFNDGGYAAIAEAR